MWALVLGPLEGRELGSGWLRAGRGFRGRGVGDHGPGTVTLDQAFLILSDIPSDHHLHFADGQMEGQRGQVTEVTQHTKALSQDRSPGSVFKPSLFLDYTSQQAGSLAWARGVDRDVGLQVNATEPGGSRLPGKGSAQAVRRPSAGPPRASHCPSSLPASL